jgi:hypothetical protein
MVLKYCKTWTWRSSEGDTLKMELLEFATEALQFVPLAPLERGESLGVQQES